MSVNLDGRAWEVLRRDFFLNTLRDEATGETILVDVFAAPGLRGPRPAACGDHAAVAWREVSVFDAAGHHATPMCSRCVLTVLARGDAGAA